MSKAVSLEFSLFLQIAVVLVDATVCFFIGYRIHHSLPEERKTYIASLKTL